MTDIAVMVIHGIGSQGATKPDSTDTLTYSKGLHKKVARSLKTTMDRVAWREVFWADVLQSRQKAYLSRIKRRTDFDKVRAFVMCNLADAAAYQPTGGPNETYQRIHDRIDETLADLLGDTSSDTPLLILAHSLGGHIVSNFIYDQQKHLRDTGSPRLGTPLQNMQTVAGLVTFGCNIPIFVFAYPPEEVTPIDYPGAQLPSNLQFSTWWHNYYDKDDVLAYPLRDIGDKYKAFDGNGLKEHAVNAGGFLTSWNPASHNAYWTDDDVYGPIATQIRKVARGLDAL